MAALRVRRDTDLHVISIPMQVIAMSHSTGAVEPAPSIEASAFKPMSLVLGVLVSLGVFFLLPETLAFNARLVAGIAMLMATWWMTEAIPIPATSLLPLVLFPFFDIASVGVTAAPYAHSIVFLVLGGVLLGLATQRWNLHRRFCRELCLYAAGRNAFQCRGVRHGRSAYPKHD